MNLSNFRIKAALAGLTLLVGTTVTPAVASNSVSSTKPQESNSKVIGNQKILLAQATDLTGTWSCGGGNIIYIRQVDSEIWWLNESSDGGLSFTNVFNGTVFNGLINGKFADVPKGGNTLYGYISGEVVSNNQINLINTYAIDRRSGSESCTR